MPHASLKLIPGVDQVKTPALNEAALTYSQLIRFLPDRSGMGLPQKLGGWVKYYPNTISTPVRNLKAWEDLNQNLYLAVGAEGSLSAISNGVNKVLTPATNTDNVPEIITTTAGSTLVVVTDSGNNTNIYSYVYINTPISIGGIVLSGAYNTNPVINGNTYDITSGTAATYTNSETVTFVTTTLSGSFVPNTGTAVVFTSTGSLPSGISAGVDYFVTKLTSGTFSISATPTGSAISLSGGSGTLTATFLGQVPYFTTVAGSPTINVLLPYHGLTVGSTFTVATSTLIGNLTLFGSYTVTMVPDANNFTISSTNIASTSSQLATITIASPAVITAQNVPISGTAVSFTTTGALPTGITAGTTYYVLQLTSSTFNISATPYGAAINTSGSQSGTHTATFAASTSGFQNNGNAQYIYYFGVPAQASGSGYGTGGVGYGVGGFGTGSGSTTTLGTPITATDWSLDNWGQILLANPASGAIYYWQPDGTVQNAQIIASAPIANYGMFVAMPQRQVVAWGSTFSSVIDPLLVRWSDVSDFTTWTATVVNQAGSYRIPTGSKIVGGIQANQQGLIWTDLDVWAMQYIGPPYVYAFNKIDTNCGLIARGAVANFHNQTYWMSLTQFFVLGQNGATPIQCPVWDVVFQNYNKAYAYKIRCATNTQFNEVTWYYPSANSTENDSYVKYNTQLQQWDYGTLSRTAWIDQSVLGSPIGADPTSQYIYQHEQGYNADTQPMTSSFQTGYFEITDAENLIFMDQIWPDMKWGVYGGTNNATVQITLFSTNYPGDTPIQYGPYNMTQNVEYITPRLRGRLVSILISSTEANTFFRLGNIRYRFQPDGRF